MMVNLLTLLLIMLVRNVTSTTVYAQTNPSLSLWAFEENFNYSPRNTDGTFKFSEPAQSTLPKTLDYIATHRRDTGGDLIDRDFKTFPADHDMTCEFDGATKQHQADTSHLSNTQSPDKSFYICKDHMMSSMGQVSGYSVTNFWPKQEFDFTSGGILEFDVNINGNEGRSWWEILITPRESMKVGAAEDWLPIDETYPKERVVLTFSERQTRKMKVGTQQTAPNGWIAQYNDWRENGYSWLTNDPANTDRRIRRKNRITFSNNKIIWGIQKNDGTFDNVTLDVPAGLPFSKGLVMFKTHAYTPEKDGNTHKYTYHWDNIRFSGPQLAPYIVHEAENVINLAANGSVPIGSTKTNTITIDTVGKNPVLFGQVEQGQIGQVLVSINDNPSISIPPLEVTCQGGGWNSFYVPLNPQYLKTGVNTFKWTVGPRNPCVASWSYDGFSIKALEVQFDGEIVRLTPTLVPSCSQRPECLDESPMCQIPTPSNGWCPKITSVPSQIQTPTYVRSDFTGGTNNTKDGKVTIQDLNLLYTEFYKTDLPTLKTNIATQGQSATIVDIQDYNLFIIDFRAYLETL